MSHDQNPRGRVRLAQWDNGWVLERMSSHDLARELGLQRVTTRPVFVLRDAEDQIVYELVVNHVEPSPKNDYLHVLLGGPDAPFPGPEARQICISAITEVLGLPLDNRYLYRGPLLIPEFNEGVGHALEKEVLEISPIIGRLAKMHDEQMRLTNKERFLLKNTRKLYTNLCLRNLKWSLNLNRFQAPGMHEYETVMPSKEISKDISRGVGIVQGTPYQLVLQLDFLPQPSWSVRVNQEYRTGETLHPEELLVTGHIGPVHALVAAGVLSNVLPGDPRATQTREAWLDSRLEDAPEVTELFDIEPYRLLETQVPYLWPYKDFMSWIEEMQHAK